MRSTRTHLRTNIVGYVALFFALTTGAYAAALANDSVKSKHIKDGQVKTADVGDESLTNLDLAPSSVTSSEIADNNVGSSEITDGGVGPTEIATGGVGKPEIDSNTVGSEELLAINEVETTLEVPVDQAMTIVASCPAGQQIISGGGGYLSNGLGSNVPLQFSRRAAGGWQVRYYNGYEVPVDITAYAYCLAS